MLPLTGYTDRLSGRPGERIAVKVSAQGAGPVTADLVRIRCADPNPAGPSLRIEPVAALATFPAVPQPVARGSCGIVELPDTVTLPDPCTLVVRVQPRLLDGRPQTVLDLDGLRLMATPGGAELVAGDEVCVSGAPMLEGRWYELRCIFAAGQVRLMQTALADSWGVADSGDGAGACTPPPLRRIVFGARADGGEVMDGRLEDPVLLAGVHDGPDPVEPDAQPVLAWWDFSGGIDTTGFPDRGPGAWHGRFHNLPTRGVRGSRWTRRRDGLAARAARVRRRSTSMPTTCTTAELADTSFDRHGARRTCAAASTACACGPAGTRTSIPLFILPPRGTVTAPVAFLAATFTYQAYANHARFNADAAYRARRAAWGAYPHNPEDHPEYGGSTYNRHPDGTGIACPPCAAPILTMRPGFLTFNDARAPACATSLPTAT